MEPRIRNGSAATARRRWAAGFTIIELMIVMSIVVILIGIAVPFFIK